MSKAQTINPKGKLNAAGRTFKNVNKGGFYLINGEHWIYKFDHEIALVDVDRRKVYMHSQHCGYNLNKMFKTIFIGPFDNRRDMINARDTIKGRNC